jgi:mono/diheme cytochrome c family protein
MTTAKYVVLAAALGLAAGASAADRAPHDAKAKSIERGRYLIATAGCNDCHTAGFIPSAGKVPEKDWLKGDAVGYRGPWGTTYASNLRLYFANISEKNFIADARSGRMRPPMPWFNLAAMTDADLRAIHRYVRSLGEPGAPAPAYVPPGEEPRTPHFVFVPQAPRAPQPQAKAN